jgi:hypothetical protein
LTRKEGNHSIASDGGSDHQDRDRERATTIVLAEFAGLRGEITTRINLQVTLMLGNLTIVGVVLGIALSQPSNRGILLILPLVTPCIGVLVIDSFRNLDLLGRYIKGYIRPQLDIPAQDEVESELFDWERWISRQHFNPSLWVPYQFVLFLEFLGPPIAVLISAIQYHRYHPQEPVSGLQRWLWWMGTVLTCSLAIYAISYGIYALRGPQGSKKIRDSSS